MNIETVDTAEMDPIVFASTYTAAQRLAGSAGFSLQVEHGRTWLTSDKTGATLMNFPSVTEAYSWMRSTFNDLPSWY